MSRSSLPSALRTRQSVLVCSFLMVFQSAGLPHAAQQDQSIDVTTFHYDSMRTGWNSKERKLSPDTIKKGSFGLLETVNLDEQVDAQPLVISGLEIDGRKRDIVYVVTENNTVYAIDAVSHAIIGQPRHLGAAVSAGDGGIIDCGNNASVIGINSTPVIDRAANVLYLVAFVLENDQPVYRLFALDLLTLVDKHAPEVISASVPLADGSNYDFNAKVSRQRAALALSNDHKVVYAAFASFCDHNADKSRGWIIGLDTQTLKPIGSSITDRRPPGGATRPDTFRLDSIWMSGDGPAIDNEGNAFFITGNSNWRTPPSPISDSKVSLPDSVVKMSADLKQIVDFFTPMDMPALDGNGNDKDFGSGGILLIPEAESSKLHLAVAAGKKGDMFLLNRDNLGKFDPKANHVLDVQSIGACWCGQSYFVGADGIGRILSSGGKGLTSWKVQTSAVPSLAQEWNKRLNPEPTPAVSFQTGFFTSISSDGVKADSAIVWAVQRPTSKSLPNLTLWAFNANSGDNIVAALPAGNWTHFVSGANIVPVVANGQVFVASDRELQFFGLRPPAAAPPAAPPVAALSTRLHPAAGSKAVLFGTVVEADSSTLSLQTRTGTQRVDIAEADRAYRTGMLPPGRAVVVYGTRKSDGGVQADWIDPHGNNSPALWDADK
jgi:hypothetical protein